MEESRKQLEEARNAYITEVLEWRQPQHPETMEYILMLEKTLAEYEHTLRAFNKLPPATQLCPHPGREKLFVKVGNGSGEATPTTVNQDTILMRKDLAQPTSIETSAGVKINREPESFFITAGMECGEKFGSANVEEARGHEHTPVSGSLTVDSLTTLISKIELDLTSAFVQRERSITNAIDGSINTIIAEVNKQRISVVRQFAAMLRKQISTHGGF